MFRPNYLAVCMAAATLTSFAVQANDQNDETVTQSEKITVVGSGSGIKLSPLGEPANVSKNGAPVEELPYSVAVVDQAFALETGAKNIQDALLYTSGVYAGGFGIDTRVDSAMVRGVDPVRYVDGLRSNYGYYNNVRPSIYALEQIEVLKGPSSVMYGQGSIGGILNAVTKRPQAEEKGELWLQAGSFDRRQIAADWTGAVDQEGDVLVRFVGLARNSGTQVDHVDDDEILFNPSVTWRISDDTDLTLIYNYQKRKGGITAQFLPTQGTLEAGPLGQLDPSTYIGEPGWDKYDREQTALTAELNHRFNDNWRFTSVARYVDAETNTREHWANIGAAPDTSGNIGRTIFQSDKSTQGLNLDARLVGDLTLGETEHTVLIGIDRQDTEIDEWNRYAGAGTNINAYNPVYGNVAAIPATTDPAAVTTKQLGFYVADHIKWNNFVLSLAGRHDDVNTLEENGAAKKASAATGQIGLMYQFANGISPYVSYAESFEANTGSDGSGGILAPTEGEQKEYGVKYLSEDQSMTVELAYFDITQLNRVIAGTTPGGVQQIGAEIDGWELAASKQWNNLSVLFNYTYLDAVSGTGDRVPYVADKQASVWGSYLINNQWRVGMGVRHTGTSVGSGNGPNVPGVTLVDAMVGYETGDWEFTADIKNLTNKTYVAWCRSEGRDCGYGEELNATVNARYKF